MQRRTRFHLLRCGTADTDVASTSGFVVATGALRTRGSPVLSHLVAVFTLILTSCTGAIGQPDDAAQHDGTNDGSTPTPSPAPGQTSANAPSPDEPRLSLMTTPTCGIKVSTERPTVLRDLKSVVFKVSADSDGNTCSLELNGSRAQWGNCGPETTITGEDLGVGDHEVKLRVTSATGQNECTKVIEVPAPAPCHQTFTSASVRTETDYEYDEKGRDIAEVASYAAGGYGQVINRYSYDGSSNRITKQVTTYSKIQGIPDSRQDLVSRAYISGPPDAVGQRPDEVKTIDYDYNSDGKIDVRQTYTYDSAGRVTLIEQRNGVSSPIAARFTFVYDGAGRLVTQSNDTNADGKPDDALTFTYDQFGVLQKRTNKENATWSYQYECQ
jgi:hypothetical protein